ncbi:related to surfeit locus protein 4 [Ustilago bromivora]|uniref:Related to surfeit locus protein 4 n=1 Tax=Ustilago bromivora TaxID=307758 RepID=A0A1K0G9H2_9BASI|nr:related to surfeit locus protein 4 [Ustilago bromivora]SYW75973.1 related to surfeit locus protein 4 [Ustilago bromivora]
MASYGSSAYASTSSASQAESSLDKVREYTSKVEDLIDQYTQPIKPHLPALGRFLIVVTFLEDALRIMTQWMDQKYYLQRHRGFPWGISHIFLLANVVVMCAASAAVIMRKYPEISVGALFAVVVVQGFGYGLIFDLNFFLRNLSVVGGLLMVLSDSLSTKKNIFAGIPSLSETDRKIYFQLAGRVLLIFLFIGFIIQGEWTLARVLVSMLGLGACIMVVVGFKARWSASFLVMILSIFNLFVNNFWTVHSAHPSRDFLRYDFFQTLSIVGGLLLLVNMGPGGLSVDERKKVT